MAQTQQDTGRGATRGCTGAPAPEQLVTRCIACRARLDSPAFGDCAHPRCPFGVEARR
jgi:hypothetical protein